MTDADYADDLVLLTNTPTQVDSLLHCLEQVAGGISLYMLTNKTEFMSFKQEGAISTLSGKPMESVNQFTYFDSKMSSTESEVKIYIVTVWTTVDRLLTYEKLIFPMK